MNHNKFSPPYVHVVPEGEQQRRERYNGCVSRQTLRAVLRQEAFEKLREQFPIKRQVKNGQELHIHSKRSHADLRQMARVNAVDAYRNIMDDWHLTQRT